jgi:O-antigen/teichoic acid export membrane protein
LGTIQKQGLINTLIIYIGVLLGLVNRIVVQPNYLTTSEIGLSGLLISFSTLLTTFFLLGASNMCVRYFPVFKNEAKKHHGFLGFMLLFPITGTLLGGIIIYLIRGWLLKSYGDNAPLFTHYFAYTYILAAIITFAITLNAYSNSLHKTTFPSFINDIWVRIVLLAGTAAYGLGWISLDWFVWGILLAYGSQFLLLIIYICIVDRPGLKIDWVFARSAGISGIFRFSILLTLTSLTSLSLKQLDNMMVGSYLGEDFSGVFLLGIFMAQFIETPLYSIERIASTKIAHAFAANNMEEIKEIYYRSVRVLFLFGGFLAVCIITNIHDFLRLLPQSFSDAAGVTIILGIGSLINMATGINSPIIINSSRYVWGVIFLSILLVISLILNMLFIPVYKIEGAAIATGIASTLYNLMKYFYIWKKFGMQPYDKRTLQTILIIGVSVLAGLFIPFPENTWLAIIIRSLVITVIFIVFSLAFKLVPEYHHLITKLYKRNKQD